MTKDILGFFGPYRWLSNFAPVSVCVCSETYPSVEHAYVASKTLDVNKRALIQFIKTPGAVKKFGRTLVLRPNWEQLKYGIMLDLIEQKFSYPEYAKLLKATGTAYLEETNTWGDMYWGVCDGIGENKLGEILMKVREGL